MRSNRTSDGCNQRPRPGLRRGACIILNLKLNPFRRRTCLVTIVVGGTCRWIIRPVRSTSGSAAGIRGSNAGTGCRYRIALGCVPQICSPEQSFCRNHVTLVMTGGCIVRLGMGGVVGPRRRTLSTRRDHGVRVPRLRKTTFRDRCRQT
jgi:hypothetical protein